MFHIDLTDDGTPRGALGVATQAVKAFAQRAATRFTPGQRGWQYPSDGYRCLGEAQQVAHSLPQVCQMIITALRAQLEAGHLAIDSGGRFEGRPEEAVEAASVQLERATKAAAALANALALAQIAIEDASYVGPRVSGDGRTG